MAITEQISGYAGSLPLVWRIATAKSILGIKTKEPKDITVNNAVEDVQKEIIAAISTYVSKQGLRKLAAIIKGEVTLTDCLSGISTTVTTPATVAEPTEDEYNALLAQMDNDRLFDMLRAVSTTTPAQAEKAVAKAAKTAKATKAAKTNKGGFTSVDDATAVGLAWYYLGSYLINTKNGLRTLAPSYFREGRVANATMALRRFLFSTLCKDECSIYNSLPVAVAEAYKANPLYKATDFEQNKAALDKLIVENPDLLEMIKGWKDEPYIKAVLKK